MPSLADAVAFAVARKKMPVFENGSTRDLAVQLGMPVPISIKDLIRTLGELPPASVTYDSGQRTALYVHGGASVFLQSDGLAQFGGQVHESGAAGDNYVFILAFPNVLDADGRSLVFAHTGNVAGQLDFGSSDDNWGINGFNPLVRDNWEQIRNTTFKAVLHVSTDPFQVVELAVLGLLVAAGIVLAKVFIFSGDDTICGWRAVGSPLDAPLIPGDRGNPPGAGFEYY